MSRSWKHRAKVQVWAIRCPYRGGAGHTTKGGGGVTPLDLLALVSGILTTLAVVAMGGEG